MKKLFLIRHSKAEDNANNDFQRKLTSDGIKLARKISGNLKITPSANTTFISSPAIRAHETAIEFTKFFRINPEIIKKDEFLYKYHSPERFLMWLDSVESNSEIWIFGHNPMLSEIVSFLTDGKYYSMPKCAVACFETNQNNWLDVYNNNTKLLFFESPKDYK